MKTFRRKSSGRKTRGRKTRGRKTRGGNKMIYGGINFYAAAAFASAIGNGHIRNFLQNIHYRNLVNAPNMKGSDIIEKLNKEIKESDMDDPYARSLNSRRNEDAKKTIKLIQEIGVDKTFRYDKKDPIPSKLIVVALDEEKLKSIDLSKESLF